MIKLYFSSVESYYVGRNLLIYYIMECYMEYAIGNYYNHSVHKIATDIFNQI